MKIEIKSYLAGSFLLKNEPQVWDAIVILGSKSIASDFVSKHARRHCFLTFDDINEPRAGRRSVAIQDIRKAIEFAAESTNLLVCCRAGQSRSAALAFVLSNGDLSILNPERHSPNKLIIELSKQINPQIFESFQKWKSKPLFHYLDEIEAEYDELERLGAKNLIENRNLS